MKSAFSFRRSKTNSDDHPTVSSYPRTTSTNARGGGKLSFRFRRGGTRMNDTGTNLNVKDGEGGDETDNICLICQESLHAVDLTHPIQCTNCSFNCCTQCIESMMNHHDADDVVVVSVHCPNCRSDLSATICDTLVLRKVDSNNNKSQIYPADRNDENRDDSDDVAIVNRYERVELFQHCRIDEKLAYEIASAREREAQFWEQKEATAMQRLSPLVLPPPPPPPTTPPPPPTLRRMSGTVDDDDYDDDEEEEENDDDHDDNNNEDIAASVSRAGKHVVGAPQQPSKQLHPQISSSSSSQQQHEEWGLEVDVRTGVHESIKMPRDQRIMQQSCQQRPPDRTLLGGLDGAMSYSEQEIVSRHLISGDTTELVLAAKLLAGIAEKVRGFQRQQRKQHFAAAGAATFPTPSVTYSTTTDSNDAMDGIHDSNVRDTTYLAIYQLIEAGKRTRQRLAAANSNRHYKMSPGGGRTAGGDNDSTTGRKVPNSPYTKLATVKAAQHRLVDVELRAQLAFLKRHPLPARMPKYCEIAITFDAVARCDANHIVKCLPFRFCNDRWDGTLMDAFTRISVKEPLPKLPAGKNYSPLPTTYSTFVGKYAVKHHRRRAALNDAEMMGYVGGGDGELRLDTPRPRVLVAAIVNNYYQNDHHATKVVPASAAARMPTATVVFGSVVVPGDIVTHLNGEELRDVTVDDIIARICSLCYSSGGEIRTTSSSSDEKSNHTDDDKVSDRTQEDDRQSSPSKTRHIRFGLVLNSDIATAKALQMRAMSIHNLYYD